MEDPPAMTSELASKQFDLLWQWSRFYHDAEIKVNTTSIGISAIATVADKISPDSVAGFMINPLGVVIIVASVTGLLSTLGYWRYYELCDIMAKYYRDRCIPKDVLKGLTQHVNNVFPSRHCILAKIPEDAHHYVWLFTQGAFFVVGLYIAFYPKKQ